MEEVTLTCVSAGVRITCSGRLCGGKYGDGEKCPCVKFAALPRYGIELVAAVCIDCKIHVGNATKLLVLIQRCVRRNDEELDDIVQHVEQQIADGTWSLVGWWKANSTSEDATYYVPTSHIIALRKTSEIRK